MKPWFSNVLDHNQPSHSSPPKPHPNPTRHPFERMAASMEESPALSEHEARVLDSFCFNDSSIDTVVGCMKDTTPIRPARPPRHLYDAQLPHAVKNMSWRDILAEFERSQKRASRQAFFHDVMQILGTLDVSPPPPPSSPALPLVVRIKIPREKPLSSESQAPASKRVCRAASEPK